MTESDTSAAPPPASPETGSFFSNLLDLFFEPRTAFERILRKPNALVPIAGYTALSLAFFAIWVRKVDARVFFKNMMMQNPRAADMPAEQMNAIIDMQSKGMSTWGWVSSGLTPLILTLLVAGVLLFIFRFFLAADVTFKQSWAVVAWTFFVIGIVTTPLILAVMQLKDDWNINPQEAVQANPTAFFEPGTLSAPVHSLLGSLDLFSFWIIFLLATGFTVAAGRKTLGSALWTIGGLWAIVVAIKVAWSALF